MHFTTTVEKDGETTTYSKGFYRAITEGTYTIKLFDENGIQITTKTLIIKNAKPEYQMTTDANGNVTITIKDFNTIQSVSLYYLDSTSWTSTTEEIQDNFKLNSDGSASLTFKGKGYYTMTITNSKYEVPFDFNIQ